VDRDPGQGRRQGGDRAATAAASAERVRLGSRAFVRFEILTTVSDSDLARSRVFRYLM